MGTTMNRFSGWSKLLDGKVAIVTGAARGIGRAAAVALAQSGAQVVGISSPEAFRKTLASLIESLSAD